MEEKKLFVVCKITEHCVLNCSYCYFRKSLTYLSRDKTVMSLEVFYQAMCFLKNGFSALNITAVELILHGGEPLLIGKQTMQNLCDIVTTVFNNHKYKILIQSNGVLIDQEWIELFKKNNIEIGISLDGTKEYHDRHRKYHDGTGSYETISKNIKLLQQNELEPGILCVANPEYDAKAIFQHFVKDLKLNSFDFLFPHEFYSNARKTKSLTKFYCDLFDSWVALDEPNIHIRIFKAIMLVLLGKNSILQDFGPDNTTLLPCITIFPDGKITPSDELATIGMPEILDTGLNIKSATLAEVFQQDIFLLLQNIKVNLAAKCRQCCWQKVCCGGMSLNRYSKENKFTNPSIFCTELREIFAHISLYMLQQGLSLGKLQEMLTTQD